MVSKYKNNKKNVGKKFLWIGLISIIVVFAFVFIFKNQLKNTELRYIYWDIAKGIHRVDSSPTCVVSFYSDSLRIVGDLFEAETAKESEIAPPCILLLHGSSPLGRKAAVIQILARKFRDKGYTVLAIDLRAYGDSEDPPSFTAGYFDFPKDVISSINYLIHNTRIDTNRIYIVGHSGGAGAAIGSINEYGKMNKAKKMVLLGPPRRVKERISEPYAKDRAYFLKRWKKDMDLSYDIIFSEGEKIGKVENIEDLVTMPNHFPLFLIDGEKESKEDLKYLRDLVARSTPPVDYWTIPGTGHYLNTKYIDGILFYEGNQVDEFVNRVDKWLRSK